MFGKVSQNNTPGPKDAYLVIHRVNTKPSDIEPVNQVLQGISVIRDQSYKIPTYEIPLDQLATVRQRIRDLNLPAKDAYEEPFANGDTLTLNLVL